MRTLSQKGGILIYMLGVVALLSIIVTEFLLDVGDEVRFQAQTSKSEDLALLSHSYLEASLAVLYEIQAKDQGLYSPLQGWEDPLAYAHITPPEGYTASVTIADETGKIALLDPKSKAIWTAFFKSIGINFDEANNLTLALEELIDSPQDIIFAPLTTPLKKRPLVSFSELYTLPIFEQLFLDENKQPNERTAAFREAFSIHHDKKININTAPEAVRALLVQNPSYRTPAEGYYRNQESFALNSGTLTQSHSFGFFSNVLNIAIEVSRGPNQYLLNAIVKVNPKGTSSQIQPFKILDLTEGFSIF